MFDEEADSATYHLTEQQVVDASYKSIETANITVGQLNFILKLESEDRSSFTSIPLFRISQVRSDGRIEFDENFIPTCLDIDASPYVSKFLEEFTALLKHRAESIVEQLGMVDQQGVSSVSDIMLLQSINRIEPLFEHFSKVEGLHPKALFEALVQVEGELATLCSKERRPMSFVPYSHGT
ncbi:uncharacterized protein ImpJ/VasE [Vibrio astriarenae]|nr:uncharacterized protein ImpJ/VasE [Vibrio sp. C7]